MFLLIYCTSTATFMRMQQWFSALPPELQELIFAHLDQNTLTNCARVSKSWNIACTPYLWRTLDVKTCERLKLLLNDGPRQAVYRNAANIHSLTVCLEHWKLLSVLVPQYTGIRISQCSNIRSLDIRCAGHPGSSPTEPLNTLAVEQAKALRALIRWNPRLTKLSFHSGIISQSLLLTVTSEVSGLQSLYIGIKVHLGVARVLLNALPSTIQSITMHISELDIEEILEQVEEMEQQMEEQEMEGQEQQANQQIGNPSSDEESSRPHEVLETLQIHGSFIGLERFLFLPFLESCSNKLTHFECPEARHFFDPDVSAALAKLGHFLDRLGPSDLPDSTDSTDAEIAELILLHPRLRSINLEGCKNAAALTADAIRDSCGNHLQELYIAGCGNMTSKDVQMIMCKASQLEKLVAIGKDSTLFQDPTLLARDITGSVWAMSSLQHFECRIVVGPLRLKQTQRQVYQQLATQSNLERIILGHPLDHELNDPPFQLDCLELTLKSGLRELSGLVKLQELSVMSLAHGIGAPELEWMAQHWPTLKKPHLFFSHVPSVKHGACEWISRHSKIVL
ncbi:hypothetical protein MVEG_10790 [Podila verticillata NRRL 6337]|nr:hypothetical protein MVEG_10790 [Podila verticillata NRRL 6337]